MVDLPAPAPDVGLVRVLATGDAGVIAIAKSLLESEKTGKDRRVQFRDGTGGIPSDLPDDVD